MRELFGGYDYRMKIVGASVGGTSLGKLGKCPISIARMSVEVTGTNRLACRKSERSTLVGLDWMALQARFFRFLVVGACGGGFGARVIVQRPLVWFC